jgi:hypothetical protein
VFKTLDSSSFLANISPEGFLSYDCRNNSCCHFHAEAIMSSMPKRGCHPKTDAVLRVSE